MGFNDDTERILERNKNINRGYRKLEVWRKSVSFYVFVKDKIRPLNSVPYKIKSQIEDSAFSVSSNLAEGYSRRGLRESIQFNNIALASLAENYSQIFSLLQSSDIDSEWFNNYDNLHYDLENQMIRFNKSQIDMLKTKSDWRDDYNVREEQEIYKKIE